MCNKVRIPYYAYYSNILYVQKNAHHNEIETKGLTYISILLSTFSSL